MREEYPIRVFGDTFTFHQDNELQTVQISGISPLFENRELVYKGDIYERFRVCRLNPLRTTASLALWGRQLRY